MKKILVICLSLFTICFCAETSLGGITLGESYDSVIKKYPIFNAAKSLEAASLPYPLSIDNKTKYTLAQSGKTNMHCYFNGNKEVIAIGVFLNTQNTDNKIYETGAGLRSADGVVELKLLYGKPEDISEFTFKDAENNKTIRKIYYYPNLCIQTIQYNELPEFIDSIVVGQYSMNSAINKKDTPTYKTVTQ